MNIMEDIHDVCFKNLLGSLEKTHSKIIWTPSLSLLRAFTISSSSKGLSKQLSSLPQWKQETIQSGAPTKPLSEHAVVELHNVISHH
jgi:hypothetical protein